MPQLKVFDVVLTKSGGAAQITQVDKDNNVYLDYSGIPCTDHLQLIWRIRSTKIGGIILFACRERTNYSIKLEEFYYDAQKCTQQYVSYRDADIAEKLFEDVVKEFENLTTFECYVKFDSLVRPTTDIGCDELICPDGNYIIVNKKSKKYWGDEGWESKTPKKFTKTEIKAAWKLAAEAQHSLGFGLSL